MFRPAILLTTLLTLPPTANAEDILVPTPVVERQENLAPMRTQLARLLPRFGLRDVDVRDLSNHQVVTMYGLIHSERSVGDIRGLLRSAAGQGLLSRFFNRR